MPTMVCVKVTAFEGVFPLTLVPDNNMPKPTTVSRQQLLKQSDLEDEEQSELVQDYDHADEDDDGGNCEVERIMEHDHGDYLDKTKFRVRYKGYGPMYDDWIYESRHREGAADTVDEYISENRKEYNEGPINATVNCVIACAYEDNNPNQEYMTMAVMEAMEQQTRQRVALQQIRDMPEARNALDQPRARTAQHTASAQAYQPASPPSSPARLPPGSHLLVMPYPRTDREINLIIFTQAEIKQLRQARATRDDWLMEAVGYISEIAEKATHNMDYDLSMAMHHAMYMQSAYLSQQSPQSPEVIKRFKNDDQGNVTANATDPMETLQLPYYAYADQRTYNEETVCFSDRELKERFTAETAVHMPLLGTYMAYNEVCNTVVLICDTWEDCNLMKEGNSLTPEQLITYLAEDLLPTVEAAELPLKQLIETALEETKDAIENEDKTMHSIRKRLVKAGESQLTEEMKKTALELRYTMSGRGPQTTKSGQATPRAG